MFNKHRAEQHHLYNIARDYFIKNNEQLVSLEHFFMQELVNSLVLSKDEIVRDYNEASYLYPFWQNYPPEERGRQPRGDQYPWIEVGEHSIGAKLPRLLAQKFNVRDIGIPSGPDQRFVLSSPEISTLTHGFTDSVWLFMDIKSVGPRDNFDHAVMSHNQVSGNGIWEYSNEGVKNDIVIARGARASHDFHCGISPIYVLSDGTVAPVINILIKPIYQMLSLVNTGYIGQPLSSIVLACIPNGLLLFHGPSYLESYPHLFYPGKDDKNKNPLKVRARVDFRILDRIAPWRVETI